RVEESPELSVQVPFLLSKAGMMSGARERGATKAAPIARDVGSIRASVEGAKADEALGMRTVPRGQARALGAEKGIRIRENGAQLESFHPLRCASPQPKGESRSN